MSEPVAAAPAAHPLDLAAYRDAVGALAGRISSEQGPLTRREVDDLLDRHKLDPAVTVLLDRVPGGADAVLSGLHDAIRAFRPNSRSSARDLPSMVRIHLLSQIDALWWSASPVLHTDADVERCPDLVDLNGLRRQGVLRFRYRGQPAGLPGRCRDSLRRRVQPGRQPHTSGLRFTRARPESVALLNQLALDFGREMPGGAPPLWVTSTVRSIEHQHRLRALGYMAVLPSAHCSGHAVDIEMRWLERFGADGVLARLLLARQDAGLVNVIDEGQAWHLCISPAACEPLGQAYRRDLGR